MKDFWMLYIYHPNYEDAYANLGNNLIKLGRLIRCL